METKRSDGMTEAQLATLDKATDVVMADIERQEYGVTPEAGLQGIRTHALRRVIKSHLSQRHQLIAVQEKEIRALQEKMAVVVKDARLAIAKEAVEASRLGDGWRQAASDLDGSLAETERWKEAARKNLNRAIFAEKGLFEVKREAQGLVARVREFMSQWRKGAK